MWIQLCSTPGNFLKITFFPEHRGSFNDGMRCSNFIPNREKDHDQDFHRNRTSWSQQCFEMFSLGKQWMEYKMKNYPDNNKAKIPQLQGKRSSFYKTILATRTIW